MSPSSEPSADSSSLRRRAGQTLLALAACATGPVAALAPIGLQLVAGLAGFAALLAADRSAWRHLMRRPPLPLIGLVLLVGLAGLSGLWSIAPSHAEPKALTLLGLLALAWLAWRLGPPTIAPHTLTLFLAGMVAGLALISVEIFADMPLTRLVNPPVPGHPAPLEKVNRNVQLFCLLCLVAAAVGVQQRQRWALVLPLALLPVAASSEAGMGVLVLLTGLIVGLIALAAPRLIRRAVQIAWVLGCLAGPFLAHGLYSQLGQARPDPLDSMQMRLITWNAAADLIEQKPLLGWGLEAARAVPPPPDFSWPVEDWNYSFGRNPINLHPHNQVLHIWLELGGLGAVLFACLGWAAFGQTVRDERPATAATLGAAAGFVPLMGLAWGVWQAWWLAGAIVAVLWLLAASRRTAP